MGKPTTLKAWYPEQSGSKPGELKHLSTRRKIKQVVIPSVVAIERGTAQTVVVLATAGLKDQ